MNIMTIGQIARNSGTSIETIRFYERCALQAHEILWSEMTAVVKPSQQPRTESCVVSGNGHCEA